jgi:hypothetical protein
VKAASERIGATIAGMMAGKSADVIKLERSGYKEGKSSPTA